jgi:hypothetical protein
VVGITFPSDQRRGGGTFQAPLDDLAAPFRGSSPFVAETSANNEAFAVSLTVKQTSATP